MHKAIRGGILLAVLLMVSATMAAAIGDNSYGAQTNAKQMYAGPGQNEGARAASGISPGPSGVNMNVCNLGAQPYIRQMYAGPKVGRIVCAIVGILD